MTLEETIKRYSNNAEYERTHGSLQGCLEFKQLADWLKELKQLREQEPCEDCISREYILSKAHCCCDDLADDEPCCVDVDDIKEAPSVQPINQNIKALGKELRTFRGGIKDEKVLTGFNMAIALCNKHLAESEE